VKSIIVPSELNTIFDLANNWLKPKSLAGGGYASTYATKVDLIVIIILGCLLSFYLFFASACASSCTVTSGMKLFFDQYSLPNQVEYTY
jgi:hypothetical protein